LIFVFIVFGDGFNGKVDGDFFDGFIVLRKLGYGTFLKA